MRTKTTDSLTPADLVAAIAAAEERVATARADRSTAASHLERLTKAREVCLHLLQRHKVYQAGFAAGETHVDQEKFWEENGPSITAPRLALIENGGYTIQATEGEKVRQPDGSSQWCSVTRDVALPPIGELAQRVDALTAEIPVAEAALAELKATAAAVLERDWHEKENTLAALRREESTVRREMETVTDVEEALGLRARLDALPLKILAAERAALDAEIACPGEQQATDGERAASKARIAELEQELRTVTEALLKARIGLEKLNAQGRDLYVHKAALRNRRAELEQRWRDMLQSRDVRAAAPPVPATRFISGNA